MLDVIPSERPQMAASAEDRELFDRLKRDPKAIGDVYDRYADRLYGFLLKRCGHKETAEDLVSRTFVKLLESAPTLEWQGAPVSAWLFRVATNALTDHWRSASVRMDTEFDPDTWNPPSDDDPSWYAEISMEGERLRDVMKGLASRDQEVLSMKFYGGFETAEIAAALGVSGNHAAVLIYRALGRLRVRLTNKEGYAQ
jgi:RNA polymerase sigma-70 factor (ECF subfamily)